MQNNFLQTTAAIYNSTKTGVTLSVIYRFTPISSTSTKEHIENITKDMTHDDGVLHFVFSSVKYFLDSLSTTEILLLMVSLAVTHKLYRACKKEISKGISELRNLYKEFKDFQNRKDKD